ncbi:MAG: HEPN domain-containing protein [Pseudomonadota bacterium]
MRRSLQAFEENIKSTRELSVIHNYLVNQVSAAVSFEDLLRSQVVYSVSAFDKFLHDIIRIGMVETFCGRRAPTSKFLSDQISMSVHQDIIGATIPPKESVYESAVIKKLKIQSYQDPSKVADGLSYIWDESQKWKKISEQMGFSENAAKTQLRLIASRRNSIVHEADVDIVSGNKIPISVDESEDIVEFIELCGKSIYSLVL